MRRFVFLIGLSVFSAVSQAHDAFDRHTSFWVKQAAKSNAAVGELSAGDAAKLNTLSREIASPCVVVQTGEGNWTKAIVSWAFRKSASKPVAVLVIERFVTYDRDKGDVAVAHGRNVMLFAGFQFDFDSGQVVPEGQGADVKFDGKKLAVLDEAKLHPLNGPAIPAAAEGQHDLHDHAGVLPKDFAGQWRVNADGRWTGVWEISVDDEGNVGGSYTSDETKSTFPIKGRIKQSDVTNRLQFDVEFNAATQSYDVYLWTTDKAALAGTTTLIDRTFGVYAERVKER
jgi:hypothetical protein